MRRSKGSRSEFFPGFTDIAEIGIGSLATVYRAREVGTNRLVALKLLNVRDASPRALESFERESIALGAVSSHPNIVTLFRSFRAADGRPVLVLELCRGAISDRMQGGQGLPVPEVVAMGIKIAGALETAHRAEILHRDVKPQNILITDFDEPALADFGVAMLQSSTQTTAGLFDFTTLHAAPELLEGGATSAATDVYELASSLYQLIAGKSAFRAQDGESPAAVILRILCDPVQPLINAQVPTQLSDLLIYAMSKDKDSRPPTAAEFAAELAAVEAGQQWPRTQFLIRDPNGSAVRLPSVMRIPQLLDRAAPAVGTAYPMTTGGHEPARPPAPSDPPAPPAPSDPPAPPLGPRYAPPAAYTLPPTYALPPSPSTPLAARAGTPRRMPVEPAAVVEPSRPRPQPSGPEPTPALAPAPAPAPAQEAAAEPPAVPEPPPPAPAARRRSPVRIDEDYFDEDPATPDSPPVTVTRPAPGPERTPESPDEGLPAAEPAVDDGARPARPLPGPWAASPPATDAAQYPIPPAFDERSTEAPQQPSPVPTWAFRAPVPTPIAAPTPTDDDQFAVDPTSLRRRVTIRAGASTLVVDDTRLLLRVWWRRSEIPWRDVHGFEARFDRANGAATGGRLVALTRNGRVDLPATKRSTADLRRLHALLDAYAQRAQLMADG